FVFTIFVLVGLVHTTPSLDAEGHTDVYLSASKAQIARILRREVQVADANWYIGIARDGYERGFLSMDGPHNWAFFPLFPLALLSAAYITHEYVFTGMLLSNVFFLVALFLLYRTCQLFGLQETDAGRCLFLISFFPTSYFFSLPVPESLFLMLIVGSVFLAKQGFWWTAGCLAALSSATRTAGIVLLPALLTLQWEVRKRIRPFQADQLAPMLAPLGLL